jgi:hypothetical protein
VWVSVYGHTSPGEFAMARSDGLADVDARRCAHASALVGPPEIPERKRRLRAAGKHRRGGWTVIEVAITTPVGRVVLLAIAAVLLGVGLANGRR